MGVRVGQPNRMQLLKHCLAFSLLVGLAACFPQFVPAAQIANIRTGELIDVNNENLDVNGCLVGPSGERVSPRRIRIRRSEQSSVPQKQGTRADWKQRKCRADQPGWLA